MTKVLCIGESREARAEMLKLTQIGCNIIFSPSAKVATQLLATTEERSMSPVNLVIVFDGVDDRQVGIKDIKQLRQSSAWEDGPIIFLSPEERENFDFDFNQNRVEFIKTPIRTRDMAEAIARIAYE